MLPRYTWEKKRKKLLSKWKKKKKDYEPREKERREKERKKKFQIDEGISA